METDRSSAATYLPSPLGRAAALENANDIFERPSLTGISISKSPGASFLRIGGLDVPTRGEVWIKDMCLTCLGERELTLDVEYAIAKR